MGKAEAVTDEMMAERRRLFLEEMARIRERERLSWGEGRTSPVPEACDSEHTRVLPAQPAVTAHPQKGPLALMALCLMLIFPIWGYIQSEAARSSLSRSTPGDLGPGSPEWRPARLQRVRAYFGLYDLIAVDRDQSGYSFAFKPGLSHADLLTEARHIQNVLAGHTFPPYGPLASRIGVCSGELPCPVTVVYRPGPGDFWYVSDNGLGNR